MKPSSRVNVKLYRNKRYSWAIELEKISSKSPQLVLDRKLPKGIYLIGFKLRSEMIWQQLLIR